MKTSPIELTEQDLRDHELFAACQAADPQRARKALAAGGNPNQVFNLSNLQTDITALFLAVLYADHQDRRANLLEIIQILLDGGADPDIVCHPYHNIDKTAREHAKENDGEIFAMIEKRDLGRTEPSVPIRVLNLNLMWACELSSSEDAAEAIKMGADANSRHRLNHHHLDWTPLFYVITYADTEYRQEERLRIAQLLLDAGADPDIACHNFPTVAITARALAREHSEHIFAMIERRDLGPPGKPGKGKRI